MKRHQAECFKCAGNQHDRCHGQWVDIYRDFTPEEDSPWLMKCNCDCRDRRND